MDTQNKHFMLYFYVPRKRTIAIEEAEVLILHLVCIHVNHVCVFACCITKTVMVSVTPHIYLMPVLYYPVMVASIN